MRIKDDTKIEAIFKATLTLVKERGLAGITMNDISKEASIGTGTLYIYFKNKEELIKALFSECRLTSAKSYFDGVDEYASIEVQLQTIFANIIRYKLQYFEVSAFLEQSYHSPYVCMTDLRKKQKAIDPLLRLFSKAKEQKLIKDMDTSLIMACMFGIIHEMVKNTYFAGKKLAPSMIDDLYHVFWDGIKS